MLLSLVAVAAFIAPQSTDYMIAGENWARQSTPARCYVEMAAGMPDPAAARDPGVRARLRDVAQRMSGLGQASLLALSNLPRERDEDLAEKQDLVENGLMDQEEFDATASEWEDILAIHRGIIRRIETSYPACGLLEPLNWIAGYRSLIDEAMASAEPE